MSKENNIQDLLHDVADAIREKKGTEDLINPQNFSDEIKSIETSSPFAVDFGEEIATGNPYTLDSLTDDIAYYNQIQEERRLYAEGLGGRSDDAILADPEFKEKIAWWPKGMKQPTTLEYYISLRYAEFDSPLTRVLGCTRLERLKAKLSIKTPNVEYLNMLPVRMLSTFDEDANVATIIDGDNITDLTNGLVTGVVGAVECKIYAPNVTSASYALSGSKTMRRIYIDLPNATNINYMCRGGVCKRLYANIPSVTTAGNAFQILYSLVEAYISGLQASIYIGHSVHLKADSIKYICDHCQAREDGASYTLTLHATVKQNFMNKCTEGNEEYDAEYAASLANANSKGLTLA